MTGRGDRSTIASAPQASRRRPRREVLETLERAGLVDDDRLAAARAEALAERGYGDAAIRFDLERQGLAAESVAAALARLEPERQRARRLVERRGGGARTARWLAQRGFDAGAVEDALAEICRRGLIGARMRQSFHPTFCLHTDFFRIAEHVKADTDTVSRRSRRRLPAR